MVGSVPAVFHIERTKMIDLLLLLAVFVGVLAAAGPAQAYLDPGTGSMILQLLLGGVAGVAVVVKLYWTKIRTFFGRAPAGDAGTENEHIPE
jgi:hypothetical protein